MTGDKFSYYLQHWHKDILAGIVVFLVAMPLCLGIALASGAPPLAGLIAGAVGGIVVSIASGSQLSVSGPANGVTVVAAVAISNFGYRGLLLSLIYAGFIQVALGFIGAGSISAYFPSSVIKGMLAAIGLMLMVFGRATRRSAVPFGPMLIAGTWMALITGINPLLVFGLSLGR